jgi:hypothetical protein
MVRPAKKRKPSKKKSTSQEKTRSRFSKGLIVSGEIIFSGVPRQIEFEGDDVSGVFLKRVEDENLLVLRVSSADRDVFDFYEGTGDRRFSIRASDDHVELLCYSGGDQCSVGFLSRRAEEFFRNKTVWGAISLGYVDTFRIGWSTVGGSFSSDKWNELMQGADIIEFVSDEEAERIISDIEDTLDTEVCVTEVTIKVVYDEGKRN